MKRNLDLLERAEKRGLGVVAPTLEESIADSIINYYD